MLTDDFILPNQKPGSNERVQNDSKQATILGERYQGLDTKFSTVKSGRLYNSSELAKGKGVTLTGSGP